MKDTFYSARLITAREQAALLSISTRHLADLVRERLIPCIRLGRALRFSPAATDEAIKRHLTQKALAA
jgi:excisionase family DNA binding protein